MKRKKEIPVTVNGRQVGYAHVAHVDDFGITVVCKITAPQHTIDRVLDNATFSFKIPEKELWQER